MKYILTLLILSLVNLQIYCDNASKVAQYAKSKVGSGYLWGTTGQKCTQAVINKSARNHKIDKKLANKWIGKEVFDAPGLVAKAFQQVGIRLATGATSAWGKESWESKGEIANYPKNKVCALYQESRGKMLHTGIYIGNGELFMQKTWKKE